MFFSQDSFYWVIEFSFHRFHITDFIDDSDFGFLYSFQNGFILHVILGPSFCIFLPFFVIVHSLPLNLVFFSFNPVCQFCRSRVRFLNLCWVEPRDLLNSLENKYLIRVTDVWLIILQASLTLLWVCVSQWKWKLRHRVHLKRLKFSVYLKMNSIIIFCVSLFFIWYLFNSVLTWESLFGYTFFFNVCTVTN